MTEIRSIQQPSVPLVNPSASRPTGQASANAPQRPSDAVDLSPHAQLLAKISQLPEVRQDLVNEVQSQIQAGTYDTPDKIDELLDELIDDL